TIPPTAQPTRRREVRMPVHSIVCERASGDPISRPRREGTQFGATKLKSSPSKTSKPQPSHAAKSTVHWYRFMSRKVAPEDGAAEGEASMGAHVGPYRGPRASPTWPREAPGGRVL